MPPLAPPDPEIAVIGRSNVGKSSLVNALLGRKRLARVSAQPGKTRLLNVFRVDDRYYLVDLPGYGYARVSKQVRGQWRRLIGDYLRQRETLRGVVWVFDIRRDPSPEDRRMLRLLSDAGRPVLAALTKSDKLGANKARERGRALAAALGLADDQVVVTSATTRRGIGDLRAAVEGLL